MEKDETYMENENKSVKEENETTRKDVSYKN